LHLAPSASFELIEQAYWVLVSRARRDRAGELRMGQLNDAYATLISPERREAHDAEFALSKQRSRGRAVSVKRPMFGRKPRPTTKLTHYQLLDVDPEAPGEIVDLAYAHRKFKLRTANERAVFERQLIEDAYATLASEERRAVYDERVMGLGRVTEVNAPVGVPPTVIVRVEPLPPVPVVVPDPAPVVDEAPALVVPSEPVAPAEHDEPDVVDEPEVPEPDVDFVGTEATVDVAEADVTQPDVSEVADVAEVRGIGGRFRKVFARRNKSEAAPKPDWKQEVALEQEAAQRAREAQHDRLSALGATAVPVPVPEPKEPDWPAGVRAQFRITGGPQAGDVVHLTNNSVILGASDAADVRLDNSDGMIGAGHVRVWRRDNEFILHQLDSFTTTYVNGERLDLRLAILESGDEIRIGQHVLVFDQSAAPAE
jgi:hypothetical protein